MHAFRRSGLGPYIVYRNPKDDVIRCALQEAARQLKAEGKPLILGARGLSSFASPITGSDIFKVLDAESDRRPALQANAIALAILGEWEGRVMTLRMIAAEDEIDELLEHALGSLPSEVGQSPAKVKQALYRSASSLQGQW